MLKRKTEEKKKIPESQLSKTDPPKGVWKIFFALGFFFFFFFGILGGKKKRPKTQVLVKVPLFKPSWPKNLWYDRHSKEFDRFFTRPFFKA